MVSRAIRLERQQPSVAPLGQALGRSGELLKCVDSLAYFLAADREVRDGAEGVRTGVKQAHVHPSQALGQVGSVSFAGVDEYHVRLCTGFIHR